jgi:hypothetical protein
MANPNLKQLKPPGAKAKRDKESGKVEESSMESTFREES